MRLINKIQNKTAQIGVIGLGYVGLPLAVEKAKAGFKVLGFDIQSSKVEMVNRGENYIGDIIPQDLKDLAANGHLSATTDFDRLMECDVVAICVPTPLDKFKQPDLSYIINSAKEIAKRIHKDMLIVLESTTYPGTTEEVVKPILEESGFKVGKDFHLAFSPERVDPGNARFKTHNTPKVVGGCTPECTEIAKTLYSIVLGAEVFTVSSPKEAEATKILENTFRIVNCALANEMAIVYNKMGINIWEVVEAAKSKPYGFQAFYPGPGLGGHCIPLDPYYLSWKAREFGFHTSMIESSMIINDRMPEYCAQRAMGALNERKKALNGAKVLVLGVAYKQDIDDYRESPALRVIESLRKLGAQVSYYDPYVESYRYQGQEEHRIPALDKAALESADLVMVTTAHTCVDYDFVAEHASLIFDTKNAMKNVKKRENIRVL